MSELSPRARALMQQASKGGGPTARQRQAVRRGVMAAVLVPAVAWAAVAKFVVAGLMVAGATAGAIVGVARQSRRPAPAVQAVRATRAVESPPIVKAVASAPTVVAPTVVAPTIVAPTVVAPSVVAPTIVAPSVVAPSVVAPSVVAQRRDEVTALPPIQPRVDRAEVREHPINTSAGLGSAESGLARELGSLDRSVRALDSEQFAEALAEAREFTRAFPQSQFVIEAQVVEVLALCGLTRFEEAKATAARLPPSSNANPAVRRLENSCVRDLD